MTEEYKPRQYQSCLICHTTVTEHDSDDPCLCSDECRQKHEKQQEQQKQLDDLDFYRWP